MGGCSGNQPRVFVYLGHQNKGQGQTKQMSRSRSYESPVHQYILMSSPDHPYIYI